MTPFSVVDLIERKRDGGHLAADEITWLIDAYTSGEVTEYQMSAMAMAVFIRGLDRDELADWTGAMLNSGDVLDLSDIAAPKIDKHSTGGVGDKVSIPLAPIAAACGVAVPMMSGRGLGHTGGTLDKLETIPGFTTQLDPGRFRAILEKCGLVLAGQSETLVPADRKLYALRDASGTVPSVPLIASSIMSKKLAEDLDGLVLDVKAGSGAFMPDTDDARLLAETMVGIGNSHGVPITALITDMNQPLGRMVGNANEIAESIDLLRGGGPPDLVEITLALAREMLTLAGVDDAEGRISAALASGRALEYLAKVIEAQGGDPRVTEDVSILPHAPESFDVLAPRGGHVHRCDARIVGVTAMRLGAGRTRTEDEIDPVVGIEIHAKVGDCVETGQPLATVAVRRSSDWESHRHDLLAAWTIDDEPIDRPTLIRERIGGGADDVPDRSDT